MEKALRRLPERRVATPQESMSCPASDIERVRLHVRPDDPRSTGAGTRQGARDTDGGVTLYTLSMRRWIWKGLLLAWAAANAVSILIYHGWPGGFGYLSMSAFFITVILRGTRPWRRIHG